MQAPVAEILTIGDEILFGQITDTNSQYIGKRLTDIGIRTVRKTSVGDRADHILDALHSAFQGADVIIVTGGLGPTKDDITKQTFCKFFDTHLEMHSATLEQVTAFFKQRGRELTELNRKQAEVPANCTVIPNRLGTAPGMLFEYNGKYCFSLPGVPFEMKALMEEAILPKLQNTFELPYILHKMIHTSGIGESFLAAKIETWENQLPEHIKLAYLPSIGVVKLRLTGTSYHRESLQKEIDQQTELLMPLIEPYFFGFDEDKNQEFLIGQTLIERNLTLSLAESCTGGYLSHLFTAHAGSSQYFKGSVIAYSNQIKQEILGVEASVLDQFGAVSEQTVIQMAKGVQSKFKTDVAASISGIAGPGGGSEDKPVGTIWLALAYRDEVVTKKLQLGSERMINIQQTSVQMLNLMRKMLLN